MNLQVELLINQGNEHRAQRRYEQALSCYAQALTMDRRHAGAFNNYGNVLREVGEPAGAIPFLARAIDLDPSHTTARFNLAVAMLLMGDYQRGWPAYESRWNFEHLAGTLPNLAQPRWTGQDIKDKTVLVIGEQGHGDNIQFCRFLFDLHNRGARILFHTTAGLVPLFASNSNVIAWVGSGEDAVPDFDYWIPLMSIPAVIGLTLDNLPRIHNYISAPTEIQQRWAQMLGPKSKMRVGICWSGRRDSWINQHKSVPFAQIMDLIKRCPQYQWISLQPDANEEEVAEMRAAGVDLYPGSINHWLDTAGLMHHLDIVLGVDTAVSHLGGAMGRPTWIMLNAFAVDWRWLLDRNDSPWYITATLFRQPNPDDWSSVIQRVERFLELNKI